MQTETSIAVLNYAFTEMNLGKVFAYADVENNASNHVLNKLVLKRKELLWMKVMNVFGTKNLLTQRYNSESA